MTLPYVDEHAIPIAAGSAAVRAALERYAAAACSRDRPILSRLLGLRTRSGFSVAAAAAGEHLRLEGSHRFASYALAFAVSGDGPETTLRAVTYARFNGVHGRIYRALIIGSRGHALATRRILRSIKRLAERAPRPSGPA
jgi:hypothetical protein